MYRILIIDDEPSVLSAFAELLLEEGHEALTEERADVALKNIDQLAPDAIIVDICLPGLNGLDALETIRLWNSKIPVIVMTGRGTMATAIEATKRGAFEYHLKPFDPEEMLATIARALEASRAMQRQVCFSSEPVNASGDLIVGRSPAMQSVFKAIGRVAPTDATVLIRGETGTGKELVARAIYQHSTRASHAMLTVNCAALPETLLESELFGHERGAFTGAVARRIGKFEQADKGTLFLDEVAELSPTVQAKLLRVLQEKTFQRVGSNEVIQSDVRLIAATNRPLEEMMSSGEFRDDLYHRLNVVMIPLPPLRERGEDLDALIDYFIGRFAIELNTPVPVLTDAARQRLRAYHWPGNVRELEYCIHRALILAPGSVINTDDIQIGDRPLESDAAGVDELFAKIARQYLDRHGTANMHSHFLAAAEQALLKEALQRAGGNQSAAARILGLPRPTLHARLLRLGLSSVPKSDQASKS